MERKRLHELGHEAWRVVARQHGVVTRAQLVGLGMTSDRIDRRLGAGRLHRLWRGVYAVGRPDVSREGRWMAAVLACGEHAVLSHLSAGALWGLRGDEPAAVELSVPGPVLRRRPGLLVHRRSLLPEHRRIHLGIPVTSPVLTLMDMATRIAPPALERAVNEADRLGLVDPETLRRKLEGLGGLPGAPALRRILDMRTFVLTDSELERRFVPIARGAGLPRPETGVIVNGFKVDFFWPELGLVVETDGLRYHRTPAQQARAYLRDQRHLAAGLLPLRFSHAQVAYEPGYVATTLRTAVARHLGRRPAAGE